MKQEEKAYMKKAIAEGGTLKAPIQGAEDILAASRQKLKALKAQTTLKGGSHG